MPRLTATAVLPAALLGIVTLGLVWQLKSSRAENAALRGELATMLLAQRAAASREGLAADAIRRASRLEEALALAIRGREAALTPTTPPDAVRAAELERVIVFLRGEITAAHETIERLKEDEMPKKRGNR